MSEHGIPVVFDVTGESYEDAAEHLCRVLAENGGLLPSIRHLNDQGHQVESWWFPEARLKHIDRNDNDAFELVHQERGAMTLPTDEDGHIDTSAGYGLSYLVRILWNTDHDGRPIPDDEDPAQTLHGPFASEEEARQWLYAYPADTDIHDMETLAMNNVRPREEHDHR